MPFEPFRIRCDSCGGQLRVSRQSLLGLIVACPKCGSMLQINPPAFAVGDGAVDSQAATQDSSLVATADGIDAENRPAVEAVRPAGGERFAMPLPKPAAANDRSPAPPPEAPPAVAWQSPQAVRRRQIALVVMVSLSGLVVAAVLFAVFVRSWDRRDRPAVSAELAAVSADRDRQPSAAPPSDPAPSDPAPSDPAPSDPAQPDPAQPESAPSDPSSPAPTPPAEAPPAEMPPAGMPPAEVPAGGPPVAAPPEETTIPAGLLPGDVLGAAGSPAGVGAGVGGDPAETLMKDLPPGLAEFSPFLLDMAAAVPDAPARLEAPAQPPPIDLESAAEEWNDPMLVADPPPPVNLRRSMSIEFAVRAEKGMPLADATLLISQLTGVPVEIDWVSFDLAGIDVAAPVTLAPQTLKAEDHLAHLARSLGGMVQQEPLLLRLTLTDDVFAMRTASLIDTTDFGDDAAAVTRWIDDFVDPQPADGEAAEGAAADGEAAEEVDVDPIARWIEERSTRQLRVLVCDALRTARGLPTRLPDAVLAKWTGAATDRNAAWQPVSGGASIPMLDSPISIAQFLRQTAARNDAVVLVHWGDANRRRLQPAQGVMPFTGEVTAAQTLQATLSPFELRARSVSATHWWVGTDSRYDRLPIVTWTPPLGDRRDALIDRLQAAMAGVDARFYRIRYDTASDRVVAMLPRVIHRQFDKFMP